MHKSYVLPPDARCTLLSGFWSLHWVFPLLYLVSSANKGPPPDARSMSERYTASCCNRMPSTAPRKWSVPDVLVHADVARYEANSAVSTQVNSVVEEEYCLIPMGGVLPRRDQRVIGIGGTAGMVHPSTGYMVARTLGAVPQLADRVVDEVSSFKQYGDSRGAAPPHSSRCCS